MTVRRTLVVLAGALLALAACGIPLDEEPRAISADDIGLVTTTTTTTPAPTVTGPETRVMSLYFVGEGDVLAKSDRATEQAPTVQFVLSELLGGTTAMERDDGLFSAIPEGTQLLGTSVNSITFVATVNLSEDINSITGARLTQAYAQLVFTATALPDVESVRFAIDGDPVNVPTDRADQDVVTTADYRSLAPV